MGGETKKVHSKILYTNRCFFTSYFLPPAQGAIYPLTGHYIQLQLHSHSLLMSMQVMTTIPRFEGAKIIRTC